MNKVSFSVFYFRTKIINYASFANLDDEDNGRNTFYYVKAVTASLTFFDHIYGKI